MRYLHYVAMYVVVANMLYRIYYAYMVDGKEFIITKEEFKNIPNVLGYYLYFKDHYPHLAKYNPMQKSTYGIFFPIFMVLQALTGFSLVWPNLLLPWATGIAGGLANAIAYARIAHFVIAMMLIMLTGVHAILAIMEGLPSFLDFFFLAKAHPREEAHEPEPPEPGHKPAAPRKKRTTKKIEPITEGGFNPSTTGQHFAKSEEASLASEESESQTWKKLGQEAELDQVIGDA